MSMYTPDRVYYWSTPPELYLMLVHNPGTPGVHYTPLFVPDVSVFPWHLWSTPPELYQLLVHNPGTPGVHYTPLIIPDVSAYPLVLLEYNPLIISDVSV